MCRFYFSHSCSFSSAVITADLGKRSRAHQIEISLINQEALVDPGPQRNSVARNEREIVALFIRHWATKVMLILRCVVKQTALFATPTRAIIRRAKSLFAGRQFLRRQIRK